MSVKINGTSGITNVDGTAASPALTGADTDTGVFTGTDIVGISTGGTERVRVDASGNVGVGKVPEGQSGFTILDLGSASTSGLIDLRQNGNRQLRIYNSSDNSSLENSAAGGSILFLTKTSGGSTGERARIDSSGNLLVGTAAQINATTSRVNILNANEGLSGLTIGNAGGSGNTNCILFVNSNGIVGTIRTNGSSTSYNTSSDYRLKENVAPMMGALEKVQALNPVTYTWKVDGSAGQGFIAHELQEVCPDAVTGEKDAVDEEGNPQYQGVDTSFLVCILTKAIQEQQAQINQLRTEIEALKGN
jgi:hypothetical protein